MKSLIVDPFGPVTPDQPTIGLLDPPAQLAAPRSVPDSRGAAHPESRRPTLTVDLAAIQANARFFVGRIPGELMAVVKADGFGHGAVGVARAAIAGGATWLGVTSVDEALALRRAGLRTRTLSWLNPVDADFDQAIENGVDLAVPGSAQLDAIMSAAARTSRRANIHLHLDVGMARDGAAPALWRELCRRARAGVAYGLIRVVGVMGHLGCADNPSDPHNEAGLLAFDWAVDIARPAGPAPLVRHLAATAATLTAPRTHYDLSRVGAGLVGIDPSGRTRLRSALTLTAPVVSVRDVPAGTPVGYGHTQVTDRPTRLALLPIGYADGVPRAAANSAFVQLRGQRCRLVGAVSMDQIVVDVGGEPVQAGEVATVFGTGDGGEPTAAQWARWAGTIEHDIVTGIGQRVVRTQVGASS